MKLPFVFNDKPTDLVQISMNGSVGRGGHNERCDVVLIQNLLNRVGGPTGPAISLKIDGISGPKTIAAITRYQTANRLIADGRIDPGKSTIRQLVALLRDRGELREPITGIGRPDQRIVEYLRNAGQSGSISAMPQPQPPRSAVGVAAGTPFAPFSATPWKFKGSGGGSLSVGKFGVTTGSFYLERTDDSPPHRKASLLYRGIGVGLSKAPAALSGSTQNLPSIGSNIRRGGMPYSETFDSVSEFEGACGIVSIGYVGIAVGLSVSIVTFGKMGLVVGYAAAKALGALGGLQVGTPDVGFSAYIGSVSKDGF